MATKKQMTPKKKLKREGANELNLTLKEALKALKSVRRFASTEDFRPHLAAVHLSVDKAGQINAVATNGHVLGAWSPLRSEGFTRTNTISFLLPLVTVKRLIRDFDSVHSDHSKLVKARLRRRSKGDPIQEPMVRFDKAAGLCSHALGSVVLNDLSKDEKFPKYGKVLADSRPDPKKAHPRLFIDSSYLSLMEGAIKDLLRIEGLSLRHGNNCAIRIEPGDGNMAGAWLSHGNNIEGVSHLTVIMMPLLVDDIPSPQPVVVS
jgi:hypothetical protein